MIRFVEKPHGVFRGEAGEAAVTMIEVWDDDRFVAGIYAGGPHRLDAPVVRIISKHLSRVAQEGAAAPVVARVTGPTIITIDEQIAAVRRGFSGMIGRDDFPVLHAALATLEAQKALSGADAMEIAREGPDSAGVTTVEVFFR